MPTGVNVAADLGKSVGQSFAQAIAAGAKVRQAQQEKAEKLGYLKNDFKNKVILNVDKQIGSFQENVKLNYGASDQLFSQFTAIAEQKGEASLEAQLLMQFGEFDENDQIDFNGEMVSRRQLAGIVTDFNNYTEASMSQIGGLVADAKAFLDPNADGTQFVIGDPTNGEQLFNQVFLTNIAGKPNAFGEDAFASRGVTNPSGIENAVSSEVKIPTNSSFLKDYKEIGGQLPEEGETKKFKYGKLSNKDGYYVFTGELNAAVYGSEEGFDLVQNTETNLDIGEVMKSTGFLDEEHNIKDVNLSQTYLLINNMTSSPAFNDELKTKAATVFRTGASLDSQAQFMINSGLTTGPDGSNLMEYLKNASPKDKIDYLSSIMASDVLENQFKTFDDEMLQSAPTNGTPFLTSRTISEKEADQLNKAGLSNANGHQFEEGQMVYVQRSINNLGEKDKELSDYKTARQRTEANIETINSELSDLSVLEDVDENLRKKIEDLAIPIVPLKDVDGNFTGYGIGKGGAISIRPEDTPLVIKQKILQAAGANLTEAKSILKDQKNPSTPIGPERRPSTYFDQYKEE
ncbi:MAG: hypothetical protein ACW98W_13585 [Candidatus Hodarchaeales archaeon]